MVCAKHIDKTSVQICLKTCSLFVGKAVFADVVFRPSEVDILVSYVHVATVQHWLGGAVMSLLQPFEVFQASWIPLVVAQTESAEIAFGIWCIARNQPKPIKFSSDDAAFVVRIAVFVSSEMVFIGDVCWKAIKIVKGRLL